MLTFDPMNNKPKLSVNCTDDKLIRVVLIKQLLKDVKEFDPKEPVIVPTEKPYIN